MEMDFQAGSRRRAVAATLSRTLTTGYRPVELFDNRILTGTAHKVKRRMSGSGPEQPAVQAVMETLNYLNSRLC
jgi:hypothetical protein